MAKPEAKKSAPAQKKGKVMSVYKLYSTQGGKLERKNPTCPKCGDGVFMAVHKDRKSCGKCGFTEFGGKKK
ncbi:MAG: 30S ribosomal protein S27ae [Nanoarchaeota archaeon]|nr:30S ribosomal protein S27ae [Nanoarchaeota archaeon]